MTLSDLPAAHLEVLDLVLSRLAGIQEPWAVAGSTGMALQGVPVAITSSPAPAIRS